MRLRCCQIPNVLVHDPSFGCYNVPANQTDNSIQPITPGGNGCPVDVLTGVGMVNGTGLVGRYCSLSISGVDYSNTCESMYGFHGIPDPSLHFQPANKTASSPSAPTSPSPLHHPYHLLIYAGAYQPYHQANGHYQAVVSAWNVGSPKQSLGSK